jgi:hypothetical protein
VDRVAQLLRDIYLPILTHLHLPLFEDTSLLDRLDGEAKTRLVATFLKRYQEILMVFHLLNAANDRERVEQLWYLVNAWLSIEEIRIDSVRTDSHFDKIYPGLEWNDRQIS